MAERKLSDDACKSIIRKIALKHKIEPRLITTRLMSEDDKEDMRRGELPMNCLDLHVELWIKSGLPDYAHGSTEPLAGLAELATIEEKKERIVTPSSLVPPISHGQWEYNKPFTRPVDNQPPADEQPPYLDQQTS
jgi:hypothetical protein